MRYLVSKLQSFRAQTMIIVALTSVLAVVLTSAGFIINTVSSFKDELTRDRIQTAQILSETISLAVAFEDEDTINANIAVLAVTDDVIAADVFTRGGERIGFFRRDDSAAPDDTTFMNAELAGNASVTERNNRLYISTRVIDDGDYVGDIRLVVSLNQRNQQIAGQLSMAACILAIAILIALGIADRSAKMVTRPVNQLNQAITDIAETGDYSRRVGYQRDDEFGTLAKNFNLMLAEISKRDETLELAVRERTAALSKAVNRAEEASRAKSEFLANMSHEIRTPMNGVLGMTEVLLGSDLSAKQRELTNIIMSSGSSLLTIINDILDFSKIEAGKLELEAAPFNMRVLVEDIARLMSARSLVDDLELFVRFDPLLPEDFIGDETRLRQVVANLVGNAVKFTDTGHILIDVTGAHTGAGPDDWSIRVAIEDTGIGIAPEKVASMFEKFQQADSSSTRKYQGTGLGLSISKSLIDLMDGDIGATSTLGEGSTFWFEIPLLRTASTAKTRYKRREDLTGLYGLIVDDNEVNRQIITELAKKWGMRTDTADSAGAAMTKLAERKNRGEHYDFILTDFHMPVVDGEDFAVQVRETDYFRDTPIIMLSSVSDQQSLASRARIEFNAWLVKPVRASQLMDAIATSVSAKLAGVLKETAKQMRGGDASANTQTGDNAMASPDAQTSGATLLLAEDNVVNQAVAQQMLKKENLEIIVAENGRIAVDLFEKHRPDLVLMDVSMPEMSGHDATIAIREMEEKNGWARTPIIAATAHVMDSDVAECKASGMDDFVPKPIRQNVLIETIAKWREGGRGAISEAG